MVDVNLKVPALEKLMDYAASGIGAVAGPMLAPWRARQDAKAKLIETKADADSLRLIADAQAEARRSLAMPDETSGGVLEIGPDGIAQRIEFQEKKRQANIKSVVQDAAAELGDKEIPDHEPDPDWTARFFDSVQDVSSEDMRKIWAKVLSREVEHPGRTSLRTLDVLKNMTKNDAQNFGNVCNFVIDDFLFYPREYQTTHPILFYGNVTYLQDIGLLHASGAMRKNFTFDRNSNVSLSNYNNCVLRITADKKMKKLSVPALLLTPSGKELHEVVECTSYTDYLHSFSRFLRGKNCELSYARIITRYSDGSITHSLPFVPIEPEAEKPGGGAS